jgi:hypothetical protein
MTKVVLGATAFRIVLTPEFLLELLEKNGTDFFRDEGPISDPDVQEFYDVITTRCTNTLKIDDSGRYFMVAPLVIWNERLYAFDTYSSEARANPVFIELMEKHNLIGDFYNKIVEVPDGVEWQIEFPDWSNEYVSEVHRTWG